MYKKHEGWARTKTGTIEASYILLAGGCKLWEPIAGGFYPDRWTVCDAGGQVLMKMDGDQVIDFVNVIRKMIPKEQAAAA